MKNEKPSYAKALKSVEELLKSMGKANAEMSTCFSEEANKIKKKENERLSKKLAGKKF